MRLDRDRNWRAGVRWIVLAVISLLALPVEAAPEGSFAEFLKAFEAKAVAAGVSAAVYERATAGLTPDPRIPALVTSQPEFATPMWDYLDQRITAARVSRGQAAMAGNHALFAKIGGKYGVDPAILGAIWGMETDYGSVLASKTLIRPILRSIATLTYEQRGREELDAVPLRTP